MSAIVSPDPGTLGTWSSSPLFFLFKTAISKYKPPFLKVCFPKRRDEIFSYLSISQSKPPLSFSPPNYQTLLHQFHANFKSKLLIIFLKHVMMPITIQFLLTFNFAAPCSMFMYVFPKKATETALYVKLTRLLGQLVALELSGYASRVTKDSTYPRTTRLKLKMKANSNVARG